MPRVTINDTVTDYSGYNKKYITDSGVFDADAALHEFGTTPLGRKVVKDEVLTVLKTTMGADSHEAFIYNMLASWYAARLYQDTGSTDKILKIKQSGLIDTHVNQEFHGSNEILLEIPMNVPNPNVTELEANYRVAGNYWDKPYVLRYMSETPEQEAFYLAHLLGRGGLTPLNTDIPIEAIDTSMLLLDPVGGAQHKFTTLDIVPWTKADLLWQWMMEYVRLNRVEHAFAASFEMLGSLAMQPLGTYHESIYWHKLVTEVRLAKFQPTRARIRTNLEGEAYAKSTMAQEFMVDSASHPSHYLTDSAVYNYMFWLGLPALLEAASHDYDDPFDIMYGGHEYTEVLQSVTAKAAVISMLFDKEVLTNANQSAYITYDITPLRNRVIDVGYVGEREGELTTLGTIPPCVSGSLIMGTVTADVQTLRHLRQRASIAIEPEMLFDQDSAMCLATMYRLFGYDTVMARKWSNVLISNYAAAADCLVSPLPLYSHSTPGDRIQFMSCERRSGRGVAIPEVASVKGNTITMTHTTPVLDVTQFGRRTKPAVSRVRLAKPSSTVHFKVAASTSFIRQTVMRKADLPAQSSFQGARVQATPENPVSGEIAITRVPEIQIDTGHASDVE
jgi:hypothetical protein